MTRCIRMAKRTHPLELVLLPHGPAELQNANGETLWTSDTDAEFRDQFGDEILSEDDVKEIFEYLADEDILSEKEFNFFAQGMWTYDVQSLDDDEGEDEDDDAEEDDDSVVSEQ